MQRNKTGPKCPKALPPPPNHFTLSKTMPLQYAAGKNRAQSDDGKNCAYMQVSQEIVSPTYVEVRQIGQMLSSGSALILRQTKLAQVNVIPYTGNNRYVVVVMTCWGFP